MKLDIPAIFIIRKFSANVEWKGQDNFNLVIGQIFHSVEDGNFVQRNQLHRKVMNRNEINFN